MLFTETIRDNRDFQTLYRKGKTIVGKTCVVYYRKNRLPCSRLGITASKKIGNAVARNRARRVIRAAYQSIEDRIPIGLDMIIVARAAVVTAKSYHVKKFLRDKALPELQQAI